MRDPNQHQEDNFGLGILCGLLITIMGMAIAGNI